MADQNDVARRATAMLRGRQVAEVTRHRTNELGVHFTDGTRLLVDAPSGDIELSVTGGSEESSTEAVQSLPTAELLTPPGNYAVVQVPDRRFPGLVVQGDSLSIICERLAQAIDGDADELTEVKAELDDALRAYIATLEERSITPPFSYRPTD